MKRSGFTLVELLIVMSIIVVLAVSMVSIFNSTGVFNKAQDATRKKDLGRIKIAFEEYYNDNGCYPKNSIIEELMKSSNCETNIFSPWMSVWPCDPKGVAYQVVINDIRPEACPKWYKVLTKLDNLSDSAIPTGWDEKVKTGFTLGGKSSASTANYGVSSSNITWEGEETDPECGYYGGCYYRPDPKDQPNVCNSAGTGCVGNNCFVGICQTSCKVKCCGVGCK